VRTPYQALAWPTTTHVDEGRTGAARRREVAQPFESLLICPAKPADPLGEAC